MVTEAERELRGDPLRLAAVYYVLGLVPSAQALARRALPTLPPAEQARVRRRFGLGDRA